MLLFSTNTVCAWLYNFDSHWHAFSMSKLNSFNQIITPILVFQHAARFHLFDLIIMRSLRLQLGLATMVDTTNNASLAPPSYLIGAAKERQRHVLAVLTPACRRATLLLALSLNREMLSNAVAASCHSLKQLYRRHSCQLNRRCRRKNISWAQSEKKKLWTHHAKSHAKCHDH